MTKYEKIKLGLTIFLWISGISFTVWIGSSIKDITYMMSATSDALERIETLVEIGPEGIKDIGTGIKEGAETAGEGLGTAGADIINKVKGTLTWQQ
ncbi:MAG: hypothetical protein COA84_13795 [Robiginitomaculum sp.]|nr:MAG: hypothetical protein COA84_13795 [Robiginitomaculum sp.]